MYLHVPGLKENFDGKDETRKEEKRRTSSPSPDGKEEEKHTTVYGAERRECNPLSSRNLQTFDSFFT